MQGLAVAAAVTDDPCMDTATFIDRHDAACAAQDLDDRRSRRRTCPPGRWLTLSDERLGTMTPRHTTLQRAHVPPRRSCLVVPAVLAAKPTRMTLEPVEASVVPLNEGVS